MASYNRIILMGNLTRDPETRALPGGTTVVNFGLATNRRWKDKASGEDREEVMFVDCQAFAGTADTIARYFNKGKPIHIEGRLRLETWETDGGQRRSKHSVVVDRFTFVQDGQQGGQPAQQPQRPAQAPPPQQAPAPAPADNYSPPPAPQYDEPQGGDIPF